MDESAVSEPPCSSQDGCGRGGTVLIGRQAVSAYNPWVYERSAMFSNNFDKKQVVRGTFDAIWRIQTEMYPQNSFKPKYGAFYLKNEFSAHGLALLFQLSWRVAPPSESFFCEAFPYFKPEY